MLSTFFVLGTATALVSATSLDQVCTASYVKASLPQNTTYLGSTAVTVKLDSVTANPVTNASTPGAVFYPAATYDYCNVTLAYTHTGRNDTVQLTYWLPSPSAFKNRYLSTGGGGYAINSGTTNTGSLPGGIQYGAVSGLTDGGFGSFATNFDKVWLINNGTGDLESLYMFGYQAISELTLLGKNFTKAYYNMSSTKLYSYYQGCSEGGRDGWSQIQRFGDELDGAVTGAPAFRFAHQQVQHLYSNVVEQTMGYYPPTCELAKIVNETIAACDPLDGKTDGVVARSDLCKLQFNTSSIVGMPYSCPASAATRFAAGQAAQNGTVSAQAIAVTDKIIDGLIDTNGNRAYFSYQPAASFVDAGTIYNATTGQAGLSIMTFGSEFVTRFLELIMTDTFDNLNGVTYDTLRGWMQDGWQRYEATLQTTWPDLTPFHQAGGKILHYHGESDDSIPPASSVHYYDSVREIMYGNLTYNESTAALSDWYKLYLIPGAAHCSTSSLQPNGPFPRTNLQVLINWVENGTAPDRLPATHLAGSSVGQSAEVCGWPLRPLWSVNGTMDCVYDQASIDSWTYELDSFKLPVY